MCLHALRTDCFTASSSAEFITGGARGLAAAVHEPLNHAGAPATCGTSGPPAAGGSLAALAAVPIKVQGGMDRHPRQQTCPYRANMEVFEVCNRH